MPELPEVETVRRMIAPDMVGRVLGRPRVLWKRTLGGTSLRAFQRAIRGARVRAVGRRGKYLLFPLERDEREAGALLVHLRMSGRLHVDPPHVERPFLRVAIELDDGRELRFLDVRKFGRLVHAADPGERLAHLGPEPLDPAWSAADFSRRLVRRHGALKPLLLDQGFLAGLGNIYVDEALHRARLHPLQPASRTSRRKREALFFAVRAVLQEAIEREGSSFDTFYRTPAGKPGRFQHQFRVYGRRGRPCATCGTRIVRIVVAQRGTHLCPRCQRRYTAPS